MSGRFHSWTIGSTQAVSRRSFSSRSYSSGKPSISTRPFVGLCHPSRIPTRLDLPARWANDRHVAGAFDCHVYVVENHVAARAHTDFLEINSYAVRRWSICFERCGDCYPISRWGGHFFDGTQRFQKSQRDVSVHRIEPSQSGYLLAQRGKKERPVN